MTDQTTGEGAKTALPGHGNLVICVPHGVWDCPKCRERNAGVDTADGPSGADWIAVGTVRIHRTGGNAGVAWSVDPSGVMVRDGETLYVKGNVG